MNKKETKSRKNVTKSFYLILLGSGVFGAILSFTVIAMKKTLTENLPVLYTSLQRLSPWIFFFLTAVILIASWYSLVQAGRFCRSWGGEDEDAFYQKADRLLNHPLEISSIGTIALFTWFGMVAVSAFQKNCDPYLFLAIAALLVADLILLAFIQRKAVEQIKLLNPEKRGDALDIRFQKEWLESCDEQEQLCVYRSSYKAFSTLPVVSGALFVLLVLFLPFTDIGFLPFLCTGLLWLIPTAVYLHEAARQKR